MGEFASKAATAKSTAGLLKMDDPSVRADTPSPIAAGSYRVLGLRTALLAGKPRGVLTALFAGGLGLAVLAGLVTCPACDHVHAHGPLDVERKMIEREDAIPWYKAAPFPRPIPGVPREKNLSGVSFAVANVTGFLARATEAYGDPFTAARLGG